jgi:hypothetical protein
MDVPNFNFPRPTFLWMTPILGHTHKGGKNEVKTNRRIMEGRKHVYILLPGARHSILLRNCGPGKKELEGSHHNQLRRSPKDGHPG